MKDMSRSYIVVLGIGRNLEDKGITIDEALYLLRNDIHDCKKDLIGLFADWCYLSDNRKYALIDMRFNLGSAGFRTFRRMIAAVRAGEFTLAAHEMMDSRWYKQVGGRGKKLRDMMLDGGDK
jgi:lysozyme